MTRLLVLGVGNVLCGDDGLGVVALQELQRRYRAPRGVRFLDGGTHGLSLLPELESADAAILIDAIRDDAPPGTLVRLEGDEVVRAAATRLSVHQIGVADLLDGARLCGRCPPRLSLIGAVPESIDLRVGLSPPVRAALHGVIESVVRECALLGRPLRCCLPERSFDVPGLWMR
jgi:hydrogenase maturation protease